MRFLYELILLFCEIRSGRKPYYERDIERDYYD